MKQWYVAQVYAGYEEIVKKDLERRIAQEKNELFGKILVPSAKMKSFFTLEEDLEDERLFPGYVLIEMEKTPETIAAVASTPKVLKFLGGRDPMAISRREIERILSQVKGDVAVAPVKKEEFVVGSEVEIKEGPFASFVGIIDAIDEDGEKMTVMVSIFGRLTPVELTFDQVRK